LRETVRDFLLTRKNFYDIILSKIKNVEKRAVMYKRKMEFFINFDTRDLPLSSKEEEAFDGLMKNAVSYFPTMLEDGYESVSVEDTDNFASHGIFVVHIIATIKTKDKDYSFFMKEDYLTEYSAAVAVPLSDWEEVENDN
jgi:hypothetical protein